MRLAALVHGALTATLCALPIAVLAAPPTFELIGSYTTGLADQEEELTSGEVAALKGDKLFVSNASDASVDIVDVSDPTAPTLLRRVDLSAHGTEVTSVVSRSATGSSPPASRPGPRPAPLSSSPRAGPTCAPSRWASGPT